MSLPGERKRQRFAIKPGMLRTPSRKDLPGQQRSRCEYRRQRLEWPERDRGELVVDDDLDVTERAALDSAISRAWASTQAG